MWVKHGCVLFLVRKWVAHADEHNKHHQLSLGYETFVTSRAGISEVAV